MSSFKKLFSSMRHQNKGIMIINMNTIINSLFGFLLALTFNDIKDTIVDNIILNIIHANIDEKKKIIRVLNADIDLLKILDLFVRLLLIAFILYLILKFNAAIFE